jgi:hypothetical protein
VFSRFCPLYQIFALETQNLKIFLISKYKGMSQVQQVADLNSTINAGRALAKEIMVVKDGTGSNGSPSISVVGQNINKKLAKLLVMVYKLVDNYAEYLYALKCEDSTQFVTNHVVKMKQELQPQQQRQPSQQAKQQPQTGNTLDKNLFKQSILLDILMPAVSQSAGQCGQVLRSIDNLHRLVFGKPPLNATTSTTSYTPNIREQLAIIYNFRYSCALMWDIIDVYYRDHELWLTHFGSVLDVGNFEANLGRMSKSLSMPMYDIVNVCREWVANQGQQHPPLSTRAASSKCFKSPPGMLVSLCTLVYYPVSGQVLQSRVCPEGSCRDKCIPDPKPLTDADIVPQLGELEKAFSQKYPYPPAQSTQAATPSAMGAQATTSISWITGKDCTIPNKDSIYFKYFERYNKPMMTGPSGTTDLILSIINYFPMSLYEKQYILLGLIVWMLVPPDHSLFEILSVASDHGVVDYDPSENEYEYVRSMVDHFSKSEIATPFFKRRGYKAAPMQRCASVQEPLTPPLSQEY